MVSAMNETASAIAGQSKASRVNRQAVLGVVFNTIGPLGVWLMPLIIGLLSHRFTLTNTEAGYLASSALFGACSMAFVQALFYKILRQRRVAVLSLGLLVAAYLLLLLQPSFAAALAIMLILGLGMGGLLVVGMTAGAKSGLVTQVAGAGLIGQASVSAVIAFIVSHFSADSVTTLLPVFLAATTLIGFRVVPWVSVAAIKPSHETAKASRPSSALILSITGFGLINFASGGFWPFIERAGAQAGLSAAEIGQAISFSSLSAIAGAGFAILLGRRAGTMIPLLAIGVGTFAAVMGIVTGTSVWSFSAAMILFGFLWNLGPPCQLPVIARADQAGNAMAISILVLKVSMAAGPLVYGPLADHYGFRAVGICAGIAALLSSLLFVKVLLDTRRG